MAVLPTRDLSALMRTCRYFLDACLRPLCARSGTLLCDDRMAQVPSFRRFLRINAGPSSRVDLVKELWIGVNNAALRTRYSRGTLEARQQWSAAFIDILRHCHNVRRLRIDQWLFDDIPFSLLVNTIVTSMSCHLEDLTMPSPHNTQGNVLCKLSRLPLRRLSFLQHSEHRIISPLRSSPVSLEKLPRSLAELDIYRCPPAELRFPMLRKLGVREVTPQTFITNATAVFPNVSHLILRRPTRLHPRHGAQGRQLIDDSRKHNRLQWQSERRDAWPSLSAIWTKDICTLYSLGIQRRMACISIPLSRNKEEVYVSPVLADTSPTFLELRIDMDEFDFRRAGAADWHAHFGPSTWSVLRLALLVHVHDVTNKPRMGCMLETLDGMIPVFPSLTHLLVRFVPQHICFPMGTENWKAPSETQARMTHVAIQEHLHASVGANTSLRWVGYEIHGLSLKAWDVSRADENGWLLDGPTLAETSESAGLAVLKRERMDEFKDVKPLHVVI